MATATISPPDSISDQGTRRRFSVEEYTLMGQAGIFGHEERLELIDGEVRMMSPIGPRHMGLVNRLVRLLTRLVGDRAIVSVQNPLRLSDYSESVPDLALLRFRDDCYEHSIPRPADVLLLIEVADSTIGYDRREKIPRYAQESIPEAWLVEAADSQIRQFLEPECSNYRVERDLRRGAVIKTAAPLELEIPMDSIFV